jgi:hypothetical protein
VLALTPLGLPKVHSCAREGRYGSGPGVRVETKGANGHGDQSGLGARTTVVGSVGEANVRLDPVTVFRVSNLM